MTYQDLKEMAIELLIAEQGCVEVDGTEDDYIVAFHNGVGGYSICIQLPEDEVEDVQEQRHIARRARQLSADEAQAATS